MALGLALFLVGCVVAMVLLNLPPPPKERPADIAHIEASSTADAAARAAQYAEAGRMVDGVLVMGGVGWPTPAPTSTPWPTSAPARVAADGYQSPLMPTPYDYAGPEFTNTGCGPTVLRCDLGIPYTPDWSGARGPA